MEKQDILIRLLKDGHITDEEFKLLYEPIEKAEWQEILDWKPRTIETTDPLIWHGVNDPKTGDPIGPFTLQLLTDGHIPSP